MKDDKRILNKIGKGGKQLRFMIAKIVEAYVFLEICERIKVAGIPGRKTRLAYQRVIDYCYRHRYDELTRKKVGR